MNMDMALDDIITKAKHVRKDRRTSGGPTRNSRPRPHSSPNQPSRTAAASAAAPVVTSEHQKINVSNLAYSVSQKDVVDLFTQIGPVKVATLNYDATGKSKGTATVVFHRKGDAARAVKEYHNRTLDERPMKIELVVGVDSVASAAPTRNTPNIRNVQRSGIRKSNNSGPARGGRSRQPAREKRPAKSQADLDADMDSYMKDSTA
ncbi:RRM motif-containing protein [Polychytrium aggregatum]|uniref:RRM motif-containing protein n=1 Tax=Polychytrium aggregatum TaxID=110093 RepID=UPI0022FE6FC4|nr:RRM motif-containing protein [Polychytrium aggregatum]KAI9197348.1 RRM motif-containing protein [Polychytrium aggregatum]